VTVLLSVVPERLIAIELAREIATIVMLLAVAVLSGRDAWERFLLFSLAFGAWDIGYYAWLKVFLGWPPSLLTWDVLFLIPVPWLGPVLAPVIVSVCLVAGAVWLLSRRDGGAPPGLPPFAWALALAGGVLVLLAFTLDYRYALASTDPPSFRWGVFGAGVALAVVGVVAGARVRPPLPLAPLGASSSGEGGPRQSSPSKG
jgi:hypothetical protein